MAQLSIRPAIASECAALEALQWRASLHDSVYRDDLLANPDAIELPIQQILDGRVFVAERSGRIRGFSAVLPRADADFALDALFVEPECWGQGVGRALVEHAAGEAARAGARCLHVVGNPYAERFYTACGFEVVGVEETRFGPAPLMRRAV